MIGNLGRGSTLWKLGPLGAAVLVGRVATAAALVVVALWAVSGLPGRIKAPKPRARPVESATAGPSTSTADAAWAAAAGLPEGSWTIDAVPWEFGVRPLARSAAEREILKPPPALTSTPTTGGDGAELLGLVRSLRPERLAGEGYAAYLLSLGDARVAVFTATGPGAERVICVRAAYPGPGGNFALLEAVPRPGPAPNSGGSRGGLLPMPEGARRLAARDDGRGLDVAELSAVAGGVDALRRHWERGGYRVEVAEARPGGVVGLTCLRGRRAVHAWVWDRAVGPAESLLLQIRLTEESGS